MAYFGTKKRSMVIVDASPVGISGILTQRGPNSQQYKIISYASRPLTPVERRYSQTDREALALVWGIEHYRLFLLGSQFDLTTDHQALEEIFNNPRLNPPARIVAAPALEYHSNIPARISQRIRLYESTPGFKG